MNEELKKEAREVVRLLWNSQDKPIIFSAHQHDIDDILSEYIDKATLAERKRCAEIARKAIVEPPKQVKPFIELEKKIENAYLMAGKFVGHNGACEGISAAIEKGEV